MIPTARAGHPQLGQGLPVGVGGPLGASVADLVRESIELNSEMATIFDELLAAADPAVNWSGRTTTGREAISEHQLRGLEDSELLPPEPVSSYRPRR